MLQCFIFKIHSVIKGWYVAQVGCHDRKEVAHMTVTWSSVNVGLHVAAYLKIQYKNQGWSINATFNLLKCKRFLNVSSVNDWKCVHEEKCVHYKISRSVMGWQKITI